MHNHGEMQPSGSLGLVVLGPDGNSVVHRRRLRKHIGRKAAPRRPSITSLLNEALPHFGEKEEVRLFKAVNFMRMICKRSFRPLIYSNFLKLATLQGSLRLRKITPDGEVFDFGLVGLKLVTDAGVDFIVDAFQNIEGTWGIVLDSLLASFFYDDLLCSYNGESKPTVWVPALSVFQI